MNLTPVTENNFLQILDLLRKNKLPTEDISGSTKLFALYTNDALIGVIGLEQFQQNALLRSLCVSDENRNKGLGKELVSSIENIAKKQGVLNLFLLTTTAAPFFSKQAYQIIDRDKVPEAIEKTSEFSSVCPASATVMKKELV